VNAGLYAEDVVADSQLHILNIGNGASFLPDIRSCSLDCTQDPVDEIPLSYLGAVQVRGLARDGSGRYFVALPSAGEVRYVRAADSQVVCHVDNPIALVALADRILVLSDKGNALFECALPE